jgi:hypothetical protein
VAAASIKIATNSADKDKRADVKAAVNFASDVIQLK